jgi:UPF0755 protein
MTRRRAPLAPGGGGPPGRKRAKRRKLVEAAQIPAAPRRPRWRFAAWAGALAGALTLGVAVWLLVLYPSSRGPGAGRAVEVVLPEHPSVDELVSALADAGVIDRPKLFASWLRATGGTGAVVGGRHLLTDDASPSEIVARVERRGGARTARVTFPEGWTRFDFARRLEERRVVSIRAFLDATVHADLLRELGIEGDSCEGFLFPATYELSLDSDAADVVRRMKREFDRRWDVLARGHAATLTEVMTETHLTVRDVVTLASMVEKEAVVDDERALIASVFLNRLRDPAFHPRHLECDPTASYGCLVVPEKASSCATFTGKATAAIEHDPDNPYSTYTHEGLPPGPIASPGAKSLEAVMAPASSRFVFFVAKGEGRHAFSETYAGHVENVAAFRKAISSGATATKGP